MKKSIFALTLFAVMAVLLVLPASGAQTDTEQQTALQIAALINGYRAEKGLYQYVYNSTLAEAAQLHTEYQASIGESTHYGLNHSTSKDRVTAIGYGEGYYIFTSEMIYAGSYATPQAALEWWKNSPIHNAIMLSTDYDEFGVGVVITNDKKYYTVDVARIRGVTSPGVGSAPVVPPQAVSAPVTVAVPNEDGSIVHLVEEGQTLQGIADAYEIPLETLLLYNGLTANSVLSTGQLILVKLPEIVGTPRVEENQAAPEVSVTPTEKAATATPEDTATAIPQATEKPSTSVPTGTTSGQGNNTLQIALLVAGVVVIGAVAGFFLLRKKPNGETEKEDEHQRIPMETQELSEFQKRPRAQQFELLREVAEMALDGYPLDVVSIEPKHYALNAEFLVGASPKQGDGQVRQYMMRVNAPGFHNKAEISSELEWLAALHRDTDLKVPFPLHTSSSEWVATVNLEPVGEPRHCVLFRNLPGQAIELDASPTHFEFIGAVIARLHKHGASFDPPAGFTRKHWDLEGLKGGMLDVPATQAYAALTENERKVVDAAERITAAAINALGVNDQVYGLIHGDLHLKSLQYHNGQPQILDFDTCGYGYFIYDLSVMVWDLFHRDDFASLKNALLQGYRSERNLSQQEEKFLMHFVAGRLMSQTLAWAGRRYDPNLAETAEKAIETQIKQLVALLRKLVS